MSVCSWLQVVVINVMTSIVIVMMLTISVSVFNVIIIVFIESVWIVFKIFCFDY